MVNTKTGHNHKKGRSARRWYSVPIFQTNSSQMTYCWVFTVTTEQISAQPAKRI